MKKLLVFLLLALLAYWLGSVLFGRGNYVYERLPQVKAGMNQSEVIALLGKPDTAYVWPGEPMAQVLEYAIGFGAPDAARVFLEHDTVTGVTYNQ